MKEPGVCCPDMAVALRWKCEQHSTPADCPDCLVQFYKSTSTYGMPVHDGGSSFVPIRYCPWCGTDLSRFSPPELG